MFLGVRCWIPDLRFARFYMGVFSMTTKAEQPTITQAQCERCGGCGLLDQWGYSMERCPLCNPTVEQSSIVAATGKQDLTIEPVSNRYKLDFDDLAQWVDDGCPEGVSGKVEDVRTLIQIARHRTTSLAAQLDALKQTRDALRKLQPALNVMAREIIDDIITDKIEKALS